MIDAPQQLVLDACFYKLVVLRNVPRRLTWPKCDMWATVRAPIALSSQTRGNRRPKGSG